MKLFTQNNAKLSSAGGSAPRPRASGGWGLCPQTPKTAPHCEFLDTRLRRVEEISSDINRGGVEDTRLEAKAKDTKKIRGQGQPFRGQNLSRPRTGMLEAKDTGASVLQKK